jgi:hypothetical protein
VYTYISFDKLSRLIIPTSTASGKRERDEERKNAFSPYMKGISNSHAKKSKHGSGKRRAAGSEGSSSASGSPPILTRDIVILLRDYEDGIPNKALKESMINTGMMICEVKLTKDTDIQMSLEASSSILRDHEYRFLNGEKQDLVSTVYDKNKFPNYSTLSQMYKQTATKTYPIIVQSVAFKCEDCNEMSAMTMGGDLEMLVNII